MRTTLPSPRARLGRPRRGGIVDVLLVVIVVGAAWVRTPVGGLFDRAVQWATDGTRELAPLTAYFVTGPPPEVVVLAAQVAVLPDVPPAPVDGFPEPWRSAARLTLGDDAIAALDEHYDGDPEAALEDYAIGAALRTRAVDRARAAGAADPNAFASHRMYLPDDEARKADRVVSGTLALATVLDLKWPIDAPHRITSPYGMRWHPTLGKEKFHDGVDLGVPIGTPILAAQAGKIARAGEDRVSGRFVIIDHGHGVRTSYCHLDAHEVEKGDDVERGAQIGLSGNTGRSTGPHLHYAVRVGRSTVDPEKLRRDEPAAAEAPAG